jgi:hypothetical protein
MYRSASELWTACSGQRTGLLTRVERYAALTIPKVCYPDNFDSDNTDESHDYQSIGAQAVNHLSNKLMLAMFAPSRPFAKLQAGAKAKKQAQDMKMTETQLEGILANGERMAIKELDSRGQRPKLFAVMRHLIVAGNALLVLEARGMRVIGLKKYVVKRNIWGEVMHIGIREEVKYDELDKDIVKLYRKLFADDTKVEFYKWIQREPNGSYSMTQWVNEHKLPKEFNGRWPADKLPYQAVTWDLADESDYGTGLVEEYIGDLEALSTLSESVVDGAVLGTEFRWMVNPTGQTSVEDLNNSENGDALPGLPADVAPTQGGNPIAIQVASETLDKYERRISRGFLMGSAVIRDAERVTQEEVRMTAQELETSYGGVYSTLASSLQKPVARWLFTSIKLDLNGADLEVTIVTGLDALSRNGDLENFRMAMGDMASVVSVPPELSARMKWEEVASFIGQGRNIDLSRFIMTDAEFGQKQQAQAQSRVEETVATETGNAAGAAAVQGPQ